MHHIISSNVVGDATQELNILAQPMRCPAPSSRWKKVNWDASLAKDKGWIVFLLFVNIFNFVYIYRKYACIRI
jgi:hypothetical protein